MLAAAGLLFGATTFGWVQHMQTAPRRDTSGTATATSTGPAGIEPKGHAQTVSAANPVVAKPMRDPMCSPEVRAAWPVSDYSALSAAHNRAYLRQRAYDAALAVPLPPPPDPAAGDTEPQPIAREMPPVPLPQAIRLVGVMDGKAIFAVPSDVAYRNNVTSSFTLGPGQKYAGITVQEIKPHSVTICDGKSICIKSLSDLQ